MTDFIIATLVYIVFGLAVLGLVWVLVTWNLWKVEMLDSKDLMGDDDD